MSEHHITLQTPGQLVNANLTLAQTTLIKKLGIRRQWIGALVSRLNKQAGSYTTARSSLMVPMTQRFDGESGCSRAYSMLSKSRQHKTLIIKPVNSTWHFSPHRREKRNSSIHQREARIPTPATLSRTPLLKAWLERGSIGATTVTLDLAFLRYVLVKAFPE